MVVAVLDTIRELIKKIDMESLKGSSIAFLHDIDANLPAKVEMVLKYLSEVIESFDLPAFVANLKSYISSMNLEAYIKELMDQIPTDFVSKSVEFVQEMIKDFDILEKFNAFNAKLRELLAKFEINRRIEVILERFVELIKQFRID